MERKIRTLVCVTAIATIGFIANNKPKMVGYDLYQVTSGDTLWSVAEEYKPDGMDIRKFVYDVADKNGIDDCHIHVGDLILVPIYE